MIRNGYVTRAQLLAEIATGDPNLNRLDRIGEQASRLVDLWTKRRFYPRIATWYYSPRVTDRLYVDDLLSVTTLKTDADGDRTYETTWAGTDYDLRPFNQGDVLAPYTQITLTPSTSKTFPTLEKSVELAAKFGYYEETVALTATVSGAHNDSVTALTVSAVAEFSVGQILKIGTEYMRVDALKSGSLTVARGVNGSTAASLSGGEAINVLTFPGITEAALRVAVRFWALNKAPLGIATAGVQSLTGETAGTRWVQEDKDLADMLEPFMRTERVDN